MQALHHTNITSSTTNQSSNNTHANIKTLRQSLQYPSKIIHTSTLMLSQPTPSQHTNHHSIKRILSPKATQRVSFSYKQKERGDLIGGNGQRNVLQRGGSEMRLSVAMEQKRENRGQVQSLRQMRRSIKRNRCKVSSGVGAYTLIPEVKKLQEMMSLNKIWSIKSFTLIEDEAPRDSQDNIKLRQNINYRNIKSSQLNQTFKQSAITNHSKVFQTQASLSRILTPSIAASHLKSSVLIPHQTTALLPTQSTHITQPLSHKVLATTFLSNVAYNFGGVITSALDNRVSQSNKTMLFEGDYLVRPAWSNCVKGLLEDGGQQDMKQSIHYGPEIRLQGLHLGILQKFGRNIKQSTFQTQ